MNRRPLALAIALLGLVLPARPASADLLISNVGSDSILRYNEATNTLTTFSSGGAGALSIPNQMTYGPDGNLYVSSLGTGTIVEYNGTTGAFMGTVVPHTFGSSNNPTTLEYPNGLAFDPNNSRYLYISSYYNNQIDRWDTVTQTMTVYATLPTTAASLLHQQGPTGLIFGSDGNLYVNDSSQAQGSQIREYLVSSGDTVGRSIISGTSDMVTHLNAPAELAFGPSNGVNPPTLIDTSFYNNSVNTYQLTYQSGQLVGTFSKMLASGSPLLLNEPGGVVYDPTTGKVIITNYLGNTLVSANLDGTGIGTVLNPTSIGGAVLNGPTYIIAIPATSSPSGTGSSGGPGGPSPAPEPASFVLFGIGSLAYLGTRLRRRSPAVHQG